MLCGFSTASADKYLVNAQLQDSTILGLIYPATEQFEDLLAFANTASVFRSSVVDIPSTMVFIAVFACSRMAWIAKTYLPRNERNACT